MGSEIKIILYILIGVAYLFNRLYRKELSKSDRKKQEAKPVSSRTSDEIFRELRKSLNLPGQPEEHKQKAPVAERKPIRPKTAMSGTITKKHVRDVKEPVLTAEENVEFAPMEFEARKAMIYSEILKRPEY